MCVLSGYSIRNVIHRSNALHEVHLVQHTALEERPRTRPALSASLASLASLSPPRMGQRGRRGLDLLKLSLMHHRCRAFTIWCR